MNSLNMQSFRHPIVMIKMNFSLINFVTIPQLCLPLLQVSSVCLPASWSILVVGLLWLIMVWDFRLLLLSVLANDLSTGTRASGLFWHWLITKVWLISAKLFTMETWRATYTVPHMIICFLLGVLLLGSELSSAISGCNQPCNTGNDCQGQLTCISNKCNDDPSVGTHICGGKWHSYI